jgi:hypothetical protein
MSGSNIPEKPSSAIAPVLKKNHNNAASTVAIAGKSWGAKEVTKLGVEVASHAGEELRSVEIRFAPRVLGNTKAAC